MFVGQFDHNIDDKGRLTIPATYRDSLSNGVYISLGLEQNLIIWSSEAFSKLYHRLEEMRYTDKTGRNFGRFVFANAVSLELDKAGRILIPQFLREKVGLDGLVKLTGSGNYIEVWKPENFEKNQAEFMDGEKRAEYFQDLDI